MAEQDQSQASAFPKPPSFYTSFTTANLAQLSKLRSEANIDAKDEPSPASKLSELITIPAELERLVPPSPPAPGQSWHTFGEDRTLPPQDLPYLDPSTPLLHPLPPSPESIVRLTRGALLAFLEIADILARDPTPDRRFGHKWEDLRALLLNAHRAVNLYRPWAARQQLIRMLEGYAENARAEIARVDELETRVGNLLTDLRSLKDDDADLRDASGGRNGSGAQVAGLSKPNIELLFQLAPPNTSNGHMEDYKGGDSNYDDEDDNEGSNDRHAAAIEAGGTQENIGAGAEVCDYATRSTRLGRRGTEQSAAWTLLENP